MHRARAIAVLLLSVALSRAQQELAPEMLALESIQTKMAENLRRLPNYTCTETIERSAVSDVLRLEVALVDGAEIFSGRDSNGAALSTGDFALRAKSVFLTDSPLFQYAGEETLDGRRVLRYDYRVPLATSHHILRRGSKQARVGYHGSIWADAQTFELARLETSAEDIPRDLELAQAHDAIDYSSATIRGAAFLLPMASELTMIDRGGAESRNRTRLTSCREYTVDSALSFGDKPSPQPTIEPEPEVSLLDRIRAKAYENLRGVPDHTCSETVEHGTPGGWPGKFEPVDPISAGAFDLHAENIFLSGAPKFMYVGDTLLDGMRAIRYDFSVGAGSSRYEIRFPPDNAFVGYHGSFWVDAGTLDLIRLDLHADDIPANLHVREAAAVTEYRRARLGAVDFLLPHSSQQVMVDASGNEHRYRTVFSSCLPRIMESATPEHVEKAIQEPLSADVLLLARIKSKAAENLERLPNYTCTQTIERTRRYRKEKNFEPVDKLRLEVALVEGRELFSWPGAGKFEEKGIGELVGGGAAIGNGSFALHAKGVFLSRAATFAHVGEELLDHRKTIRYNYRVPQMLSGYRIKTGGSQAFVGYHGAFWVDAATLDLIRLEVHADDIPRALALNEASDTMEYHRANIGGADFLLPQSSELLMVDLAGNSSRNRTQFSGCRQYAGESKLSFADPIVDAAAPATPAAMKEIHLPPGATLEIRLETPIQSNRSARGDLIKASLTREIKKDGVVIAPKGAVLTGRITRLEHRSGAQDYYAVGMELTTVEFDGARGDLRATLQDPGVSQTSSRRRPFPAAKDNVFMIRGSKVNLPHGHNMVWRTE